MVYLPINKAMGICRRSIAIAPEVEVPPANEDLLPRADHLLLAAKDLLSRSREAQFTGAQWDSAVGFLEIVNGDTMGPMGETCRSMCNVYLYMIYIYIYIYIYIHT